MALLTVEGPPVYLFSLSPMVNLPFGSTERGCCLMPTSCRARRALLLYSYPPNLRSIPCRFIGMYYTVLSEHGIEGGGGGISQNLYRPSPALLQHTWSSASAQLAFWRSSSSWAHGRARAHLWAPKTIFPPSLGGVAVNPLCSKRRYLRVAKA